jgi:glycosyltransferase involved in cell wall biosynthesis
MLHDTPVLATPRGAIPEVLGDRGGWLASDATAPALQEALAPLLHDPSQLVPKREGLRQWALRRFDFDRYIRAMLDHYRAAAGGFARDSGTERTFDSRVEAPERAAL